MDIVDVDWKEVEQLTPLKEWCAIEGADYGEVLRYVRKHSIPGIQKIIGHWGVASETKLPHPLKYAKYGPEGTFKKQRSTALVVQAIQPLQSQMDAFQQMMAQQMQGFAEQMGQMSAQISQAQISQTQGVARGQMTLKAQLLAFTDQCTKPGGQVSSAALKQAYNTWCEEIGETPQNWQNEVVPYLRSIGCKDTRIGKRTIRGFKGLVLLTSAAQVQTIAQNKVVTEVMKLAHVPTFIDACCVLAPMADIPSALLQQAYEAWCVETNQTPHPWATEVGPALKELGLTTKQMRRGGPQRKHWLGITLNEAGLSMVRDGH